MNVEMEVEGEMLRLRTRLDEEGYETKKSRVLAITSFKPVPGRKEMVNFAVMRPLNWTYKQKVESKARMTVEGNVLEVMFNLEDEGRPSKTGKSTVLVTEMTRVPGREEVMALTVFRPNPPTEGSI